LAARVQDPGREVCCACVDERAARVPRQPWSGGSVVRDAWAGEAVRLVGFTAPGTCDEGADW